MAKKFLKTVVIIILVLIIIPLVWSIQDSTGDYDNIIFKQIIVVLVPFLIVGVLFGGITDHVAKSKGYESGFAWGFWLGIIGLLVVGFRPSLKETVKQPSVVVPKHVDIEVLSKLASLHENGILTDEEFQQKKAEILKNI